MGAKQVTKKRKGSKRDDEPAKNEESQAPEKRRDLWFHPRAEKTLADLKKTPEDVQDAFGHGLRVARKGKYPKNAKPWKGEGSGVYELKEDDPGGSGTYRCVYLARFAEAIYVLHVWHKKSTSGAKTADDDVQLVKERLKWALADYAKRYPKGKKGGS